MSDYGDDDDDYDDDDYDVEDSEDEEKTDDSDTEAVQENDLDHEDDSVVLIVKDEERVTDNRLQKNELAQVVAIRAKQISDTALHFADNDTDAVVLAFKEVYSRRCPIIIRRLVGYNIKNKIIEEWRVNEMTLPSVTLEDLIRSIDNTRE